MKTFLSVVSLAALIAIAPLSTVARANPPSSASDDVEQIARQRQENLKAYEALNQVNPFSSEYGKGPAPGSPQAGSSIPQNGPMAALQKTLSNPAVQAYLKFFTSPKFSQAAEQIMNSPHRNTLIYFQIAWLILIFIYRAWRLSKIAAAKWGQMLWFRFHTAVGYLAGAIVFVPWMILGDPYYKLLAGAWEVWSRKP